MAHNRLLAPEDWFLDAGQLEFLVENQAVMYWGVPVGEPRDDPPVFQGVNHLPESIEWHPEHECCSEFLVVMLHWQAAAGGFSAAGMADVGRKGPRDLGPRWRRVGQVGDLVAFQAPGRAACFLGEGDDRQLYVGARTGEDYVQMRKELRALRVRLNDL